MTTARARKAPLQARGSSRVVRVALFPEYIREAFAKFDLEVWTSSFPVIMIHSEPPV
jgi:hypothetical protein